MKLIKLPGCPNPTFVNPDFIVAIEEGDPTPKDNPTSIVIVAFGNEIREYKCKNVEPKDIYSVFESESVAEAIVSSMRKSFGDSSCGSPAFLEAIAMSIGYKQQDLPGERLDTVVDAINGLNKTEY